MSPVNSRNWQPEFDAGPGERAALGFILMSTDLVAEADIFRMAPDGVSVHFTRLKTNDHTTNATLAEHLPQLADAAARLQPDVKPAIISYCCTSGSIINGEERVCSEIRRGAPWAEPLCLATGVIDALRAVDAKKLVVGTPYLDEINTLEADWLAGHGFEVLDIQGLNLATGIEFGRVTPGFLKHFAVTIDQPGADAIFLSCSGMRALDAVPHIEAATGKPVITSNQAQLWSALRRAGVDDPLTGLGTLFTRR